MIKIYKIIKVRCKKCNDIIEFHYKNSNELGLGHLVSCRCGAIQVDPSPIGTRIIGKCEDFEEMSEEM